MSRIRRPLFIAVVALSPALLAACNINGIGSGNKLETLEISRQTALIDRSSPASYVCFTDKLQLIGTFTNGGRADYSARGRWRSSNPDIVAVSNGDILFPGSTTTAYASGTIVPKAEGTATITAEFVGLSASYDVEVRRLPDDAIQLTESAITLAPETVRGLSLTADVDGYLLNVTGAANWSFVDEGSGVTAADFATIGVGSGIVVAKLADNLPVTLRARAEFPLCQDTGGTDPLRYEADVTVAPLTGLTLEREFTDAPNDELIVGTTEAFKVTGHFDSGAVQDLTGQVPLKSDNVEVATALALVRNIVSALKAGTVGITAVYGGDDGNNAADDRDPPQVDSNTVTLNTVVGELQGFTIAPLDATLKALGRQQFTATGTFLVNGETRSQPITRGVSWLVTTTDGKATAAASYSNALGSAGLVASLLPQADTVKVKATRGSGDSAQSQETTLCIYTPDTAAPDCPPPSDGNP
ncbi:hypothetical protein AAG565_02815 [Fontimonas sp. SYSU GA230001]|uniref:hypothetical protein n=1 Tax=Fontimonas sp. SYSU GA230001 TaxID=3142450 RepID=UPI0032B49833